MPQQQTPPSNTGPLQDLTTVNNIFELLIARGDATAALVPAGAEWKPLTAAQMYGRVRAVAAKMQQWGIRKGDRVALVSENRWEWPVVDFAILAIGAVGVPLYQTLTPEQMGFILRDAGAKAIFLSTAAQYKKLTEAGDIAELEHVSVFDKGDFSNTDSFADIMAAAPALEPRDAAFDATLQLVTPDDLATIVYTSGTTGDPKGVQLTHRNLASNMRHSTDGYDIHEGDVSISFLPLSHALARHLDYALYGLGAVIAYLPSFDGLPKAMKSVRPTIFVAVPRVFEKVRQSVEGKSHGLKGTILKLALGRGKAARAATQAGRKPAGPLYSLADKLVFSKIREAFGGRARVFISGGAPLGVETTNWFLDAGIRVFEGYGLTETSPVISRNTAAAYRAGSVGALIPNIEVRVASDGEIECKGESVFTGYWQKEAETKKEFTDDGWFKTGDIGKLEDGFLSITDRKKELMKTSGGKYIAPQPVESKLKVDSLVGQAALIGDNKKFVSVLISPNFDSLAAWAKKNGVDATDHAKLVADPKVKKAYDDIVKNVNTSLAHFESIKKVIVVPDDWTVDSGELTPSMKLKRRVIVEKYKDAIAAVYKD